MDLELKVLKPEEIKHDLISFFKNKNIIPIVGAGLTCGLKSFKGEVPNGSKYKQHMIEELKFNDGFSNEEKNQLEYTIFSNLCDYYEDDENVSKDKRDIYLKNNFYQVKMNDDIRKHFLNIDWPYIYSLNIDDAIENNSQYNKVILPYREFNEEVFDENKCLIKLHGDIGEIVTYKKSNKIFTSKEYALSLEKNAPLLNKLRNDYQNQNILFIGCSLDDEIDLKTMSGWPFDRQAKDSLSRTILFVKGIPSKLQKSKYKTYGVTDVVYFDEYQLMYNFLEETWNESKKIQDGELGIYNKILVRDIKKTEKKENQEFYLRGNGLYDSKQQLLQYPFYFIRRNIALEIVNNLSKSKIHLIYGRRISGKSYLLADLYRIIQDRNVYYFDGKSRLSKKALNDLLDKINIVALFDVGTLSREQFEMILQKASILNNNKNNFIIALNLNDSDALGIVKWKLKEKIIQSTDVISYYIKNKFINEAIKEIKDINDKFPIINLPPYNSERTFIDQLIYVEQILSLDGRFTSNRIKIENDRQLALLIVMAIKEKMYSSDIVNFYFDTEIIEVIKQYPLMIERTEVSIYEKDFRDLSHIKYVLNSKYWLRRELGKYARDERNYSAIARAYCYIIKKIIEFSGTNEYKQTKICRDYVLFDVMNDIFLDKYQGNLKLIVHIYTSLHSLLARDFNFLHQKAKCYLKISYFAKKDNEKRNYLSESKELSVISREMIEEKYNKHNNQRLLISMAHVQYTIATVLSELCKLENYTVKENVENTIDYIYQAVYSTYNYDDYQRERRQPSNKGIVFFIKNFLINKDVSEFSKSHQDKIKELYNYTIK